MNVQHLIPLMWFRLVVLAAFIGFCGWKSMWLPAGLGAVFALITIWQLVAAYRMRGSSDAATDEDAARDRS